MKKSVFFPIAMVIFTAVFTSCHDDLAEVRNFEPTMTEVEKARGLDGNYKSMLTDANTRQYYTISIKGEDVTLNLVDEKGRAVKTVYAKGKYNDKGEMNVALNNDFQGMKSLHISKKGTFYFECKAQMSDGETQSFGFLEKKMTRVLADYEVLNNDAILRVAKVGIAEMLKLLPGGEFIGQAVTALLPMTTMDPDMTVKESYMKLNEGINEIQAKLNKVSDQITNENTKRILMEHHNVQRTLFNNNIICLAQIASLCDAYPNADVNTIRNNPELRKEITSALKEWGDRNVEGNTCILAAMNYMEDVAKGYGFNGGVSWAKLIDTYAERTFAWEHQGYEMRDLYRTRDMITSLQTAMILDLYNEFVNWGVNYSKANLEAIKTNYKNNAVVRNNNYAICQIPGANHIAISRNSFYEVPLGIGEGKTPTFNLEDNFVTGVYGMLSHNFGFKNIDNFVIPNALHHKENGTLNLAANSMLTEKEAKAIYNYYGGKKTFHQILVEEAGIKDVALNDKKESVILLYGTNVSQNKIETYTFNIVADVACHIDQKDKNHVFDNFWMADYYGSYDTKNYSTGAGTTSEVVFKEWRKWNQNKHIVQVRVHNRTKGWERSDY